MPEFDRLLIFRALRPDRLTSALRRFVAGNLGPKYVASAPFDLARSFEDSAPGTPMFVFLSPGVDVVMRWCCSCCVVLCAVLSCVAVCCASVGASLNTLTQQTPKKHNTQKKAASVEALGAKLGFTADSGRYASVSLGQGQEPVAMAALEAAHRGGGWVLLQNVHLTIEWTSGPLEKRVDKLAGACLCLFCWFFLFGVAPPPSSLLPQHPPPPTHKPNTNPPKNRGRAPRLPPLPLRRAAARARARPADRPAAGQRQAHERAARRAQGQPAARVQRVQRGRARG